MNPTSFFDFSYNPSLTNSVSLSVIINPAIINNSAVSHHMRYILFIHHDKFFYFSNVENKRSDQVNQRPRFLHLPRVTLALSTMAQPFAAPNVQNDYQEDKASETDVRDAELASAGDGSLPSKGKALSFYFAFLSLVIMVLLVSLDSTALGVAIPVSRLEFASSLQEKTDTFRR